MTLQMDRLSEEPIDRNAQELSNKLLGEVHSDQQTHTWKHLTYSNGQGREVEEIGQQLVSVKDPDGTVWKKSEDEIGLKVWKSDKGQEFDGAFQIDSSGEFTSVDEKGVRRTYKSDGQELVNGFRPGEINAALANLDKLDNFSLVKKLSHNNDVLTWKDLRQDMKDPQLSREERLAATALSFAFDSIARPDYDGPHGSVDETDISQAAEAEKYSPSTRSLFGPSTLAENLREGTLKVLGYGGGLLTFMGLASNAGEALAFVGGSATVAEMDAAAGFALTTGGVGLAALGLCAGAAMVFELGVDSHQKLLESHERMQQMLKRGVK